MEEEQESILPDNEVLEEEDVEMPEVEEKPPQNVVFQTKPTLQRIAANIQASDENFIFFMASISYINVYFFSHQMQPSAMQLPQSQSIMIVSSPGGQGASQILKISHPPNASPGQLQSLAQSIMSGKAGEANIVQLRATPVTNTITSTPLTFSTVPTVKTVQTVVKRPAQIQQNLNVRIKKVSFVSWFFKSGFLVSALSENCCDYKSSSACSSSNNCGKHCR